MARFVLSGRADCPYYAKAELLADYLQKNLPYFRVHKVLHHPDTWEPWLNDLCKKNNWKHTRSPIIWRELLDRGGKGLYLGGFNDFMEHAQEYYNVTSDMLSDLMKNVAVENMNTYVQIQSEAEEVQSHFNPLHIWITSASLPTCYHLIPLLVDGEVFGMNNSLILHLLDSSCSEETLKALVMEAEDLAYPLLRQVTMHSLTDEAFLDADVVIVLDDALPKAEQSAEAHIKEATDLCVQYGRLISQNANKGVKVVVTGSSYVNLKALVIINSAPSIDHHNVVALPTQLEFEAKGLLASKLNTNAAMIRDVIVWGNISGINHLGLQHAKVYQYESALWGPANFSRPLLGMMYDSMWIKNDLLQEWRRRRQHRKGMSAAYCIAKLLSWWYQDSNSGEIVSLGVLSEGQFELPEGIVYSMPIQFQNGSWHIYTQASVSEDAKEILLNAAKELIKEKGIFLGVPEKDDNENRILGN
ncbi:putative malate dehydrogenase 1B [Bombina bombina]|uniref:putative malate dehydrogenase 1B n=1 Tax=Bombina bombina TaxID=8345 RepID=UPI00235AA395|nr:putative malate dehydrogenase 1B [Bombina bombina]